MKTLSTSQSGQALLIILLIAAVSLTIGLSITSRSITDIRISQRTEESARAYSAAEAGIEEALATGLGNSVTFSETGAKFNSQVTGIGGSSDEFAFPQPIGSDETQTLSLASWNNVTKLYSKSFNRSLLRVAWGNQGSLDYPALEVNIYYLDSTTYKNARFMLDPLSSRTPDPAFCNPGEVPVGQCSNVTAFSTSGVTIDSKNFQYLATLDLLNAGVTSSIGTKTPYFARLRVLYTSNSHVIGAQGAGTIYSGDGKFPSQGTKVQSTGQSGDATRAVQVTKFNPAPPELFDFAMYSGTNLSK
ncbi:MAG: hypothetical protein Q8Q24_01330 [bacterium]|nr:hypothetical protein [bacterium]